MPASYARHSSVPETMKIMYRQAVRLYRWSIILYFVSYKHLFIQSQLRITLGTTIVIVPRRVQFDIKKTTVLLGYGNSGV